jgi:hypothetical protein
MNGETLVNGSPRVITGFSGARSEPRRTLLPVRSARRQVGDFPRLFDRVCNCLAVNDDVLDDLLDDFLEPCRNPVLIEDGY